MDKLPLDEVHIDELLSHILDAGQNELYLESGCPPRRRSIGRTELSDLCQYEVLSSGVAQRLVYDVLTDENIARLENRGAIMFRYPMADGSAAFNVHAAVHRGQINVACHQVPHSQ